MTWVKIDDNLPQNVKVRSVPVAARWAYLSSICYAGNNRTDGFIPRASLALVDGSAAIAEKLVAVGLWETAPGGWQIHDFLRHNRSKDAATSVAEKRREAGQIGAAKRWQIATHENGKPHGKVILSGSGSLDPDLPTPFSGAEGYEEQQEQERQNDGKLPDAVYRQIDTAWIQSAGTTLPRVAGERFETYALKLPLDWVLDAIAETGHANKKDPRYTYAILDNWIREGREQSPPDAAAKFKTSRFQAGQPVVGLLAESAKRAAQ